MRTLFITTLYCGILGLVVCGTALPLYALTIADFNLPPQNANGWTILTPEQDSRLIYVDSASGNDSTGQVYSPGDSVIGSDPQNPVGPIQAFATLNAAYGQTRDDEPDWMLLRAGSVWTITTRAESLQLRRGRSATERSVVCAYGTGARPELRTGTNRGIDNRQASNVIVSGIRFWAHTRDTEGPYFQSYDGNLGFGMYNREVGDARVIRDVLIEDCIFRAYESNVVNGGTDPGVEDRTPVERFVIRRSIISGNYSTAGHSQGLYNNAIHFTESAPPSILLEGNTLDHNGWRIQSINGDNDRSDGQATIFNHNVYFANSCNVLFTGNIFMRASSMHNKFTANEGTRSAGPVVIDNNLYVEGDIGLSAGGNAPGARRFYQFEYTNNVLTNIGRNNPIGRELAWYVNIVDWEDGIVSDNLILNQKEAFRNVYALKVEVPDGAEDVEIFDNIIYDIESTSPSQIRPIFDFLDGSNATNVSFSNNIIDLPNADPVGILAKIGTLGGYQFSGNHYNSSANPSGWFETNGSSTDLGGWISYTGESDADSGSPGWNDPNRNLEIYINTLGLGNTFQDFIDAVYAQSRANWDPELTAPVINDWFRAGFTTGATNNPPVADVTASATSGTVPLNVNLDATGSSDPDSDPLTYEWDFDDGNGFVSGNDTEAVTFNAAGIYDVVVRVDDGSLTDTDTVQIQVDPVSSSLTNTLNRDYWTGISGNAIDNLLNDGDYPNNPDGSDILSGGFEAVGWSGSSNPSGTTDWGSDYGERIYGYLVPEETGNYIFWLASDNQSALYLSTDETPGNAVQMIDMDLWTGQYEWDKDSVQKSSSVSLTAGEVYYIEVVHKEGGGGDHCALGWAKPGESTTTPSEIVPASVLSAYSAGVPSAESWSGQDVGSPSLSGSFSENNGIFIVEGAGTDIWSQSDQFYYVTLDGGLSGDGAIEARVVTQENTHGWAKGGVMIRDGLAGGDAHASSLITISNGAAFQRRISSNSSPQHTGASGPEAAWWVRIERDGDDFTAYHRETGSDPWTQIGSAVTISMSAEVEIGLAVTSHDTSQLCTVEFDNVTVE